MLIMDIYVDQCCISLFGCVIQGRGCADGLQCGGWGRGGGVGGGRGAGIWPHPGPCRPSDHSPRGVRHHTDTHPRGQGEGFTYILYIHPSEE